MALTQSQLVGIVAQGAEPTRNEPPLAALEDVVLEEIGNAQELTLAGVTFRKVRRDLRNGGLI